MPGTKFNNNPQKPYNIYSHVLKFEMYPKITFHFMGKTVFQNI